ncbi:hypothetical protein AND_008642 [Anopheles darlingi]|uniref:Secreted protein n=1 Tax=Anopheles darlingi TaxID=43151 RepID=W5J8P4_ANODA|nr:hypothetical protein AND_008642 [Anopheles darlingi]
MSVYALWLGCSHPFAAAAASCLRSNTNVERSEIDYYYSEPRRSDPSSTSSSSYCIALYERQCSSEQQ